MTLTRLEKLKSELPNQAEKLYRKTMTLDALFTIWDRFIQVFDWLIKDVTIETLVSHILQINIALDWNIPELTIEFQPLGYTKGVYGKSRYGLSYYDPVNWVEAMKRLSLYFITKSVNYVPTRIEVDSVSEALGIPRDYVYDLACRVQQVLNLVVNNIICGFWICGISKLSPTTYEMESYVTYIDYYTPDYTIMTTDQASLVESTFAPVCGRWVCGFGRVVARTEKLYKPIIPQGTEHWIDGDVLAQMDRFVHNLTGFKLLELAPFEQSRKIQRWTIKMDILYIVDNIVYTLVSKVEKDPIKINTYIRFAWEYIFSKVKKHKPSKKGFQFLTDKDFERYLITKWKKAGLREDLMLKIIELLRPLAQTTWERIVKGIW